MKQVIDESVTLFTDEGTEQYLEVTAINGRFVRLSVLEDQNTSREILSAENPEWVLDVLIPILKGEEPQDSDECPLDGNDQKLLLGLLTSAKKRGWFK